VEVDQILIKQFANYSSWYSIKVDLNDHLSTNKYC